MRRTRVLILLAIAIVGLAVAVLPMREQRIFAIALCLASPIGVLLIIAIISGIKQYIDHRRHTRELASRLNEPRTTWIRRGRSLIGITRDPTRSARRIIWPAVSLKLIGLLSFGLALTTMYIGVRLSHPRPSFATVVNDLYPNLVTSLVGLGFTLLVLDSLYSHQHREQRKQEAIRDFGSIDNSTALRASETIRAEGWHQDGSLARKPFFSADLRGAQLGGFVLAGCMLGAAQLDAADLTSADLEGAVLAASTLDGAAMADSRLAGTDLRGAEIESAQLMTAHSLRGARMPDGKRYDGRFALVGDLAEARRVGIDLAGDDAMARFYGVSVAKYRSWHRSA